MGTLPVDCAASTWKITPRSRRGAELVDVLDDADLVVHVHDGGEDRVLAQRRVELAEIDEPARLRSR